MPQTSMNIRMDADVKRQAQMLFSNFGIDMTTAVNIFLRQAIRTQSIPFPITMGRASRSELIEACRRDALAVANSPGEADMMDFVESIQDTEGWK